MKKKFILRLARKLTKKNAILLAITALALCASSGSRGDELCHQDIFSEWINPGTGDWFDSSNWCDGQVPICLHFACISNGGTAQIISTDPTANACETFIGSDQCQSSCPTSAASGNLSVNGGTLNTCNELHVGYRGTGTLKITNSGVINTTFGADIGGGGVATSNGAASVDGTNSTWVIGLNGTGNIYVGGDAYSAGGTGLLQVTNGGAVSAASVHVYTSGTLAGNSTVKATNGTTVEGTLAPNWTLTNDGDLIFAGPAPLMQCSVVPGNSGNDVHVTGAATLTGKLSVTMTGTFTCGTTYTLLHADNGLGNTKFGSYSITFPPGQGWSPQIIYDYVRNNVNLNLACNTN